MDAFLTSAGLLALVTLTFLEIVLGVDNVIFISILSSKLPRESQPRARRTGLVAAMFMRIALLMSIAWIIRLTAPLFSVFGRRSQAAISSPPAAAVPCWRSDARDSQLEGDESHDTPRAAPSFRAVIAQIMLLDIVFSLDSVITAVGMAEDLSIMITAVVLAVAVMMFSAEPISEFVNRHPTIKVLALSFLLLIGVSLVGDGLGMHVPKGYIYFAMGFSVFVEMINLRVRWSHTPPVALPNCTPGTSRFKAKPQVPGCPPWFLVRSGPCRPSTAQSACLCTGSLAVDREDDQERGRRTRTAPRNEDRSRVSHRRLTSWQIDTTQSSRPPVGRRDTMFRSIIILRISAAVRDG
jgi:predicted tellurium resistance membrane protein TerC